MAKKRGRTGRNGREGRLNRDRVIEGALELIDEEGLNALSMRRLAEKLGVKPMTLYSHVSDKDDLIDGVVVRVLEEVELPAADGAWDEAVREAFASYRQALLRHPHVVPIIMRRPARDAEAFLAVLNYSLGLLMRGGLDARAALNAHRILTAFTTGLVITEVSEPDPRANPILLWAQLVSPDRFPQVFAAMPHMLKGQMDETFNAGLELIIRSLK